LHVVGAHNTETSEGKHKPQSQLNILAVCYLLQISAFAEAIIMPFKTYIKEDNLNTTDYKLFFIG